MHPTNIEWVFNPDGSRPGFSASPITGKCPVGCYYCYAERIRKRFKKSDKIEFHPEVLEAIERRKKPAGIFIGSATPDNWHPSIPYEWQKNIVKMLWNCSSKLCMGWHHIFYLLTKNPDGYLAHLFPPDTMLGVTITKLFDFDNGYMGWTKNESSYCMKFLSFEPLLGNVISENHYHWWNPSEEIRWIIVGAMTKSNGGIDKEHAPKLEWLMAIREKCKQFNIPLFEKNNLVTILGGQEKLIQEKPF